MRKVRLSKHSRNRWNERVELTSWRNGKIADLIYRELHPRLRTGLDMYSIDGNIYHLFRLGVFYNKLVFVVVAPDSEGLWSGWRVVTFLTDDVIDNINSYFDWIRELSGKEEKNEQNNS